ncbi:hypothetical protein V8E51_015176 [Hyaloscypha variabilis]
MNLPGRYEPFKSDVFGLIRTQPPLPAETDGQKRILAASKDVRNYLGLLDEYIQAIRRRGTFSDDAIVWYVKGYEKGDLWEDIRKGFRELGERLQALDEAMIETDMLRGLSGKVKMETAQAKGR